LSKSQRVFKPGGLREYFLNPPGKSKRCVREFDFLVFYKLFNPAGFDALTRQWAGFWSQVKAEILR